MQSSVHSFFFTCSKNIRHKENTEYPQEITHEVLMRKALLPRVYSPDSLIPDKLDDKSKSGPMSLHKGHSKTSWRPLKRQQVVLVASEQNSIFAKKGSETYIVQETSNYQSVKGRASVRRE